MRQSRDPAKKCPGCRLINPPDAERCDCGWDFAASCQKPSYLPRGTATTAAAGVGGLAILAFLAHFALLLLKMWSAAARH